MHIKTSHYEIKEATPSGEIQGVAWDFQSTPDADGDFIMPSAFKSGAAPAMLIEHKGDAIGSWPSMSVDDSGVTVIGQIDKATKQGREAISRARDGDLKALSLGFSGQYEKSGRHRIFSGVEIAEISLVRQPANRGARVTAVKSLADCETLTEFEKSIKARLGISRRQARAIASAAWPQFNETDPAADALADLLQSFRL